MFFFQNYIDTQITCFVLVLIVRLSISVIHDSIICYAYVAGRGGSSGGKFRITLGLPVGAVINCADNTGMLL
jgi:hypothetical protein